VLVELIGRLDGRDVREAVRARITDPLGLAPMLGLVPAEQDNIKKPVPVGEAKKQRDAGAPPMYAELAAEPDAIAAGVPGGGGVMTAADLALFYQALMGNPGELWRPDVLADATGNIRCRLPEPMFGVAVNRSIGLVIAGDDGLHQVRYAGFGESCGSRSFGHAGMHMQVAWADPDTGISFAYLTNGADADPIVEGIRGVALADVAARVGV
jgi:CubicO group peptidase (beta-lactamase class C family)